MEKELTQKEIEKILDEISKKMVITYGVYYDNVNRMQKNATKTVEKEQKDSEKLLRDIKVCLICPECASAGIKTSILTMVKQLDANFSWAFWHYENCILRTGYQPYIKDVQKQREKFNGYFKTLENLGAKRDAEKQTKQEEKTL